MFQESIYKHLDKCHLREPGISIEIVETEVQCVEGPARKIVGPDK